MKQWTMKYYLLSSNDIFLQSPSTINYNDESDNRRFMVWNNLIVGYHYLHNVVNYTSIFVDPTLGTNIITNDNILTQYGI